MLLDVVVVVVVVFFFSLCLDIYGKSWCKKRKAREPITSAVVSFRMKTKTLRLRFDYIITRQRVHLRTCGILSISITGSTSCSILKEK